MDTGFLAEEDVRIVCLLIKNQISLLLKDRQQLLLTQQQQQANQANGNDGQLDDDSTIAMTAAETNIQNRFEMIQKQQKQYKHTEIPVNLMEESVAVFAPGNGKFYFLIGNRHFSWKKPSIFSPSNLCRRITREYSCFWSTIGS